MYLIQNYIVLNLKSFSNFLKRFKYSAHHHIVDAEGVDDEGLQIGEEVLILESGK